MTLPLRISADIALEGNGGKHNDRHLVFGLVPQRLVLSQEGKPTEIGACEMWPAVADTFKSSNALHACA